MLELLPLFLIIGLGAGLLAGLLGIGGGLLIVPSLSLLLARGGLSWADAVHVAVATSMASIVLTGAGSALAHHRRGAVRWQRVAWLAPGLVAGAWLASALAAWIGGEVLARIFGVFALLVALRLLWPKQPPVRAHAATPAWMDGGVGIMVGLLSALVGIGGGSLNVPYLNWRGLPMAMAVGTAAACGLPLAGGATLGYTLGPAVAQPGWALLGAVHWPAALALGAAGIVAAPRGAALAHRWPEARLRRVFALLLLALGARMLL